MTAKVFWATVIKIFGLWLFLDFLEMFSQLSLSLTFAFSPGTGEGLLLPGLAASVFVLVLYLSIIALLLFKSAPVVEKLGLDKAPFPETIQAGLKSSSVITIAVILIGGMIFINGFSLLCKSLYDYFKQQETHNYNPTVSWIIFNSVKALIGYLLVTNGKAVAHYIRRQSQ